ncbi:hypothetical protein MK280_16520, partial [Myxococcota bacterium]|nr:hypothetical protein [Myxococcota bacterium]
ALSISLLSFDGQEKLFMLHLDLKTRAAVLGTLYTGTDAEGGHSEEQRRLLESLARHVLRIPLSAAPEISPKAAATTLKENRLRRAVGQILVTLELVRHPPSAALTARVGEYLDALEIEDGFQQLAADYLADDRERVYADWERIRQPDLVEPFVEGLDDARLNAKMDALGKLPPKSLGRGLFEFYRRNGFPWISEADDDNLIPHDMTHVLAGYGTTPEAEVALQGFLVGAARGEAHFSSLLASLLLFEVGMMPFPGIEPVTEVLARPGGAELFAAAIERGLECHGDIAGDHEALLARPLAEVRAELGIAEPEAGPHMFIV